MNDLQILAPTLLEYWAVRRVLPQSHVVRTGVALARWAGAAAGSMLIVCGLAGALAAEVQPGTILVPEQAGLPAGRMMTAPALVTGTDREVWARRGFVGADMEAGLLADRGARVATVRAVLDSPGRDISQLWLRPAEVMRRPRLWGELFWLSRAAPTYALLAARVLRAGLALLSVQEPA